MTDDEAVNAALWGMGRRGVLEIGERLERVGFVIGQGVILVPAPGSLTGGRLEDGSLYIPDEHRGSLAVQVEVRLLDEGGGGDGAESKGGGAGGGGGGGGAGEGHARLIDRWEAYHGRRGAARFAVCGLIGARLGDVIVDGDDLQLVNTLGNEGALLRRLNSDRALLARRLGERLRLEVHEPTAVGVDQRGADVRTRTGVMRVAGGGSGGVVMSDVEAAAFVERLLGGVEEGSARRG